MSKYKIIQFEKEQNLMNYIRVIDEIFRQFVGPKFAIRFWDGQELYYGSGPSTIFTLIIKDARTIKRLLAQGSLGFGEAYMKGDIEIQGDIEAYLKLRHQFKAHKPSLRLFLDKFVSNIGISRTRKSQIAYHYDTGNSFFEMFLDKKTMSYSAGHYKTQSENLEDAQTNKLNLICQWFDLPADSSVLDLGSGWGGFAKYAAENFHWKIMGYTLSAAQLNYCKKFIENNNLAGKISFKNRDMVRNLPDTEFDGIVMIESIEHIGKKNLARFFKGVKKSLKPNGLFIIQTSGRYTSHSFDRWTQKYVFPGGYLPSKDELLTTATEAGFLIEDFQDDTPDYLRTISEWIKRLENHRSEIENQYGQSFYRLWELWMHGAKVNFEIGSMNLFRLRLRKYR